MRRHWVIDGRFLSQQLSGVQRYAAEIVRRLDEIVGTSSDLDIDIELIAPPDASIDLGLSAIRTRRVGKRTGHLWEQLELPRFVRGGLVSLCNSGPLLVRRQIVCMHDANTFNAPQSYSRAFRTLYRLLMPALGRRVARVATVSAYSAGELARHGVASRDHIVIAPNGHEHARFAPVHSERTRAAAGPDTIVLVGSQAPHKNMGLIVGLAPRLAAAGLKVAIVGGAAPTVFASGGPAKGIGDVTWLGRVSDGEMAALLADSLCLAFPSIEEGFGLPPLEAMAIGCPVVSSNRASLPEICGDAALMRSPDDPDGWLDAFLTLKQSPDLQAHLVAAGRRRASVFSWDASAVRYLEVMAEVDGLPISKRFESLRHRTADEKAFQRQ